VKTWLGIGILIVIISLGWLSADILSFQMLAQRYVEIKTLVNDSRFISMVAFAGVYCAAVALSLPIALLLTLTGAALFGWWGALAIWIGATTGALCVFVAVRFFLHDWAETRLAGMVGRVRTEFQANPFQWALSMRLIPLIPFWMANALPALLGMSATAFVLSTAIGILPGTLVYVGLGVGFDQIFSRGEVPDLSVFKSPEVIGPLLALGIMSVISTLVTRYKQRKNNAEHSL
jgi:uncharacterized membrane protein YdjX (TVP38/TMEM64 family)